MDVMKGKTLFVVNLRNANDDQIYGKIKRLLIEDNYQGCALKVAHGIYFNNHTVDVDEFASRLRGLVNLYGWHWNILDDPEAEAIRAVLAIERWGLKAYMIDYEADVKEKPEAQVEFVKEFRVRLPDFPLGLCSYRYPSYHPEIQWKEILEYCTFHAPQVYWVGRHNPAEQLQKSYDELMAIKRLPVIPVGAAYSDKPDEWKPTTADLQAFDKKAKSMKLPGVQWFTYRSAKPLGLLPTLATLNWEVDPLDPGAGLYTQEELDLAITEAVLDCKIRYDLMIDEIKELHAEELATKTKEANNDALNNLIKQWLL